MYIYKDYENNLRAVILHWGKPQLPAHRHILQCLNTFLVVTSGGQLLVSGMLLKPYGAQDRAPRQRIIHPQISILARLRNLATEKTR